MSNLSEVFSKRLKQRLNDLNKSQDWLASESGLSLSMVHKYANGKSWPRESTLESFAKILDVSPLWLIGAQHEERFEERMFELNKVLSFNLRRQMELHGHNFNSLSKVVGVSRQIISAHMSGDVLPNLYTTIAYSKAFNVSVSELISEEVVVKDEIKYFEAAFSAIGGGGNRDRLRLVAKANYLMSKISNLDNLSAALGALEGVADLEESAKEESLKNA
jgi:transcriptional regulator with XRE-family HTH domain